MLPLTSFKNVFLCLIPNLSLNQLITGHPLPHHHLLQVAGLCWDICSTLRPRDQSQSRTYTCYETQDRIYSADAKTMNEGQNVDNGLIQRQWVQPMHLTHLLQQWHRWSDRTLQYVYRQPIMHWLPLWGQNDRRWPH